MTTSIDRVAVTGGNGKIGEAILGEFAERGYETVNVARGKRREDVADRYCTTDLLDAGETYGALASTDVDAVVHMGTIPSPVRNPEHVTFESNAMSAYHVLEAATELGLEAVVLPSSINVMGADYQDAPTDVRSLPVDEDHPLTPRDPYALGKHTTEVLGDGFGRRPDAPQVASLRYPWVGTGAQLREKYAERDRSLAALRASGRSRSTLFSYLHLADAASIARRAVEADFDGHEPFWAVAADTNADVRSETLAAEFFPDAERRRPLDGHESLVSVDKARELLDWEPEHSWRDE
ncbi:NAD-dependent epimerase/dehydratase family protein [Halosimplex salinum]|uniref:NAD-dependent epimerase/dehydratase family protein n=1 Tax=Halosimplex salinum TaxID=1710538 RepID=UPI000F479728|nr:NAD(P)-dependent oxidoreductase [Halosimplex salinum]